MEPAIRDFLTRPDVYFAELMKRKESLKIAIIIILIGGVIAAVHGYLIGGLTGELLSSVMPGMTVLTGVIAAIGSFVFFFVIWLIFSGIFYALSLAFKGNGSFTRTLEVVGLGSVPQVIGGAITLLMSLYYIPRIRVPQITSIQNPEAVQGLIQQLMSDPAMRELTTVSTIIGILFIIWSANLWIFGIRHARALSLRHAVITIGLPVAIYIIYTIVMLIVGIPSIGGS